MTKSITDGIDLKCKKSDCNGKIHITFPQWWKEDFCLADDKQRVIFLGGESTKAPLICPICKSPYKYNTFFHVSDEDLLAIIRFIASVTPRNISVSSISIGGSLTNTNIIAGDNNTVTKKKKSGNSIIIGNDNVESD